MTTELTTAGLSVDTFEETLESIQTDQLAEISPVLDLSTSSPLGQLNNLMSRAITLHGEALQAIYAAMDPDSATGDALDRLCAIIGVFRRQATKASVTLDVNLDAATYAAGDLVAHVVGRPADRFVNRDEIVSVGGSNLAVFEAETAGYLLAPTGAAGTYVIAGPVTGWNSIGAATLGSDGSDFEPDSNLRIRRAQAVELPGSSSARGIQADILANVDGVISAYVVENNTDATVDSIPPHSIEVVVYGPVSPSPDDNLAVAEQIYQSKAAGIGTHGNSSPGTPIVVNVEDTQGKIHVINFTRPTLVPIGVEVDVVGDSFVTGLGTTLEQAVIDGIDALDPGEDVTWGRVAGWIQAAGGDSIYRITSIYIDSPVVTGGTSPQTDYVIDTREKAVVADPADISVSVATGSP